MRERILQFIAEKTAEKKARGIVPNFVMLKEIIHRFGPEAEAEVEKMERQFDLVKTRTINSYGVRIREKRQTRTTAKAISIKNIIK